MKLSAEPFYRPPSSESARREDAYCINESAGMVVVIDGVSEPFVGVPCDYGEPGKSGGAVVADIIRYLISMANSIDGLCNSLLIANDVVRVKHKEMGRDVTEQAVAGACVAACHIHGRGAIFVVVGDAGILWEDAQGCHYLTNFSPAAHALEEAGNEFFEACKKYGAIVGEKPWALYNPFFKAKQYFRANRNNDDGGGVYVPGKNGGHGMVNGNRALERYWTVKSIDLSSVKWILVHTDGILWRDFRPENCQEVAEAFNRGGIPAILELRDSRDNQPHIQAKGWPEGTVIVLKPK